MGGILLDMFQKPIGIFTQLEKNSFLPLIIPPDAGSRGGNCRPPTDSPSRMSRRVCSTNLIGAFINVTPIVDLLKYRLDGLVVARFCGAHKIVVLNIQCFPQHLKGSDDFVNIGGGGGQPSFVGRPLDFLAVFIGACEKKILLARQNDANGLKNLPQSSYRHDRYANDYWDNRLALLGKNVRLSQHFLLRTLKKPSSFRDESNTHAVPPNFTAASANLQNRLRKQPRLDCDNGIRPAAYS